MYEELIGQKIKCSYFKYNGTKKVERFINGVLTEENKTHIKIVGWKDSKTFLIRKENIQELSGEGKPWTLTLKN